jgi:putative hydrolase of the HAD superfamily
MGAAEAGLATNAAISAVIFDFGMVLTGMPDMEAHDAMVRITGLSNDRFEQLYWKDRHAYDEGKLNGATFWQKFALDGGLHHLTQKTIEELNSLDARYWTTQNPAMVAWQQKLKAAGLKTAILSNMGDTVLESIEREFKWIHGFDVLIWSFQLKIAKPDPAIYHAVLDRLGVPAVETLFIDDKPENIEAARKLGMTGVVFTNVDRLREDLAEAGIEVPLPEPQVAEVRGA